MKTKTPPKPAKLFRKPIAEADFKKKHLGLIEQDADRAFLESVFLLSRGSYVLKEKLDRDSLIRLNKLGKAIIANRGLVKKGPLVLAALLAAAFLVFGLFFMNPLLERALERSLEAVFGARAEASSFRLDLFRLGVSMKALAVADRDEPMSNLFETGRIRLNMSPASLFRGRVYIEEASVASIALGRPRSVSGALPDLAARPKAKKAAASSSGAPLVDLARFDAGALIEREKSKLTSVAAYEKAGIAFEDAVGRWKESSSASRKSVADLAAASKPVIALQPKAIKTVPEALKAAKDAKDLIDASKSTTTAAGSVASGIRSDAADASALEKAARSALDKDFAYLKSFVDLRSGAAAGLLEPLIKDLLSDEGEKYFYYGERAIEAALALAKSSGGEKAAKKPKSGGLGRGSDVYFPSAALPRFRLGRMGAGFIDGAASWTVDLREISSEPSLVPEPSSLEVTMSEGGSAARVKAVLDLRKAAAKAYSVDAQVQGFSADLGEAFSAAGLGGLKGRASGTLDLRGEAEGGFVARGGIELRDAAASSVSGAVGEALVSAMASAKTVRADLVYELSRGGEAKYSIRTNLDSIVAKAFGALAARYTDKAVADLRTALRGYAGKELEGKLGSKVELDKLLSSSLGDEKSAASIVAGLEGKAKDLESRAKELGTKAVDGVKIPKGIKAPKFKP